MLSEEEMVADRTNLVLDQWPRLTRAFGCMNCDLIFSTPDRSVVISDGLGKCPACASESVFDIVAALAKRPTPTFGVQVKMRELIDQLDAELDATPREARATEAAVASLLAVNEIEVMADAGPSAEAWKLLDKHCGSCNGTCEVSSREEHAMRIEIALLRRAISSRD